MKKLKQALAFTIAGLMVFGLVACGGGGSSSTGGSPESTGGTPTTDAPAQSNTDWGSGKSPQDFETFTIAVVEAQATDEAVVRRDYFENYIAPYYNVKFIFSEICSNAEAEVNFMESAADAGAKAVISFRAAPEAYQMCQIAADLGMFFVYNGNRQVTEETYQADFDNFVGAYGSSVPLMVEAYRAYISEKATDDGSEGFLILSGMAPSGNIQQGEITRAMLETMAERYDLTYDRDIEDLTITDTPVEATNDKGVNIYVYPGTISQEGWLSGVSSVLQTGKYGFMISSIQSYTATAQVVEEVENAFDFNITVMSVGALGDSLTTAISTMDKFGNPSVDFVSVQTSSVKSSGLFAMAYNALTGYKDMMRGADGLMTKYEFDQMFVTDVTTLEAMADWESSATGKWCANYDYVNGMLGIYNPDLTWEDIQSHLDEASNHANIYNRLEG